MLWTSLARAPAKIRHRRYSPKSHAFESELTYLWFNPDQIEHDAQTCKLWSVRRWNILSIKPDDFLTMYSGSIRERVKKQFWNMPISLLGPTGKFEYWPYPVISDFALIQWCFITF